MIYESDNRLDNRVIVLMEDVNILSVHAMRLARSISDNITAFTVVEDEDSVAALIAKWQRLEPEVPYLVRVMPDGRIVEPLLECVQSLGPFDEISVIIPQLIPSKRWQRFLHFYLGAYLSRRLRQNKNIVVVQMPYQLIDDDAVLNSERKGLYKGRNVWE